MHAHAETRAAIINRIEVDAVVDNLQLDGVGLYETTEVGNVGQ